MKYVNAELSNNIAKKYHTELKRLVKEPSVGDFDRLTEDIKTLYLHAGSQSQSIRRTAAKALFWHVLSQNLTTEQNPTAAYAKTIQNINTHFGQTCIKDIFAGGSFFGSKRTYDIVKSCHLDKDRVHTRAKGLWGYRWGIGWFRDKLVDSITETMNKAEIHKVQLDSKELYEFSFKSKKEAITCAEDVFRRGIVDNRAPKVHEAENGRHFFNVFHTDFEKLEISYSLPKNVYPIVKPIKLLLTEDKKLERAWRNH